MSNKQNNADKYPILAEFYSPALNDGMPLFYSNRYDDTIYNWRCPKCGRIITSKAKNIIDSKYTPKNEKNCPKCGKSLSITNSKKEFELTNPNIFDKTFSDKITLNCEKHGEYPFTLKYITKLKSKGLELCPKCRNERLMKNTPTKLDKPVKRPVSLSEYAPHLLEEWDHNNLIQPDEVSYGSSKKAKWICKTCGHKWETTIKNRAIGNRGCSECNHKIRKFADVYPQLKKNFSDKNNFPFEQEFLHSTKKAIWVCDNGHESEPKSFESVHNNFRKTGRLPCGYCSKNKIKVGLNSFFDTHPELLVEWDYERNKELGLIPEELPPSYDLTTAWWICKECGGSYSLKPNRKLEYLNAGRNPCPNCDERGVIEGVNDLLTTDSELAKEYSENNIRSVTKIRRNLSIFTLWKCRRCGGEYSYPINKRELNDDSCPYCSGKKVLPGFNDITVTHEDLAKNFAVIENMCADIDANPSHYKYDSAAKVWWNCPDCGNKFMMSVQDYVIFNKRKMKQCPKCKGRLKNVSIFYKV